MKIYWKKIDENDAKVIESWMSEADRKNLCMQEKGWAQTASDIWDCLQHMTNGQFRNCMGFDSSSCPIVAIMFGVEECGKTLNIYNILVNPRFRGKGVAKQAIADILSEDNLFKLNKTHSKIKVSTLPDNDAMRKVLKHLNFTAPKFDGEYLVYEKNPTKNHDAQK